MNDPYLPRVTLSPGPPRTCDKARYPSKKDALTAINHRMHGHQRNRPSLLRPYPCRVCGGWHLSHKPDLFA